AEPAGRGGAEPRPTGLEHTRHTHGYSYGHGYGGSTAVRSVCLSRRRREGTTLDHDRPGWACDGDPLGAAGGPESCRGILFRNLGVWALGDPGDGPPGTLCRDRRCGNPACPQRQEPWLAAHHDPERLGSLLAAAPTRHSAGVVPRTALARRRPCLRLVPGFPRQHERHARRLWVSPGRGEARRIAP